MTFNPFPTGARRIARKRQGVTAEDWIRVAIDTLLKDGELHSKYGRPEDARRLLREVAGAAHAEEMRARAQELLDGLDAQAAAQ